MYGFPFQVDIDVTEACNFNCAYCSSALKKDVRDELTIDELKSLVDELYEFGVSSFNFAGGEPLMKPRIHELIEHTLSKVGTDVTLVTNGSLINDVIVNIAIKEKSFHLIISLDSVILKVNRIYRAQTETVISHILELKSLNVPFSIAQVLTNRNIEYFIENKKLLDKAGINKVLLIKYISLKSGDDIDEIPYDRWKKFVEKISKMKRNGEIRNYSLSVACPWEIYIPMLELGYEIKNIKEIWNYQSPLLFEDYKSLYETGCHAGITSCNILPNGDVYPCSISGKNKKLLCGNIRQKSFSEIWKKSEVLNEFRNIALKELEGHCYTCKLSKICGGGCRVRAFYKGGSILSSDQICPYSGNI